MGIYCCYISPPHTHTHMTLFFKHHLKLLSLVCERRCRFSTCVICFIENEKFLVSLIYDSLMSLALFPERKISVRERKFYRSCGDLLAHFGVRAEPPAINVRTMN